MRLEISMPSLSQENGGSFVLTIMHSRTWAHLAHLRITGEGSFGIHQALDRYYNEIVPLVDRLVEAAQGAYSTLLEYPATSSFTFPGDLNKDVIVDYFKTLRAGVDSVHNNIPNAELVNIIEEMLELLDTTLYKIQFLK